MVRRCSESESAEEGREKRKKKVLKAGKGGKKLVPYLRTCMAPAMKLQNFVYWQE